MSTMIEVNKLPILLEELSDKREVKITIFLFKVIVSCLLIGLLGLEVLIPSIRNFEIFDICFWEWSALGLLTLLGWLVSHLIVKVILYLLKLNRFCRVRILFIAIEEKNSLHRFFCFVIVFIVGYYLLYHPFGIKTEHIKSREVILTLLLIIMISSFTWLMISILLKLHKIKCHNDIYFDRVTKSILEQYVLRMLLGLPELQNYEINKFKELSQLNKKDVTARIMDKLMKMVRDGSLPSVEELGHVENSIEAAVTKSILQNIIELGFSSSHVENIKKFWFEQSELTITIFEREKINEKALHHWVETVYQDRRTLVSDLKKTNIAITKQHLVIRIAVGVILIFYTWYCVLKEKQHSSSPAPMNNSPPSNI